MAGIHYANGKLAEWCARAGGRVELTIEERETPERWARRISDKQV